MSSSYVLDTNVLLYLIRGNDVGKMINQRFGLLESPFLHTLSVVTHAELAVLADRNVWGEKKRRSMSKALAEFVTVDVAGMAIIDAYRMIEAASVGITMGKNDIWIAATALVSELPLVTTDKDFKHLAGGPLILHYVDPKSA